MSNQMLQTISLLTTPFVQSGFYNSQEQALKQIVLDYINRQINKYESTLQAYEQKYQQSFQTWTDSLLNKATIADEDDWLEWEATIDMKNGWQEIEKFILKLNE